MSARSNDHQKRGGKQYFDSNVQIDSTLSGYRREVVNLTASSSLSAEDSGKVFFVNPTEHTTIALPSAVANPGWNCSIFVTEADGGTLDKGVTISTYGSELYKGGAIALQDGAAGVTTNGKYSNAVGAADLSHLHFVSSGSDKATSGERVDIVSDGVGMYADVFALDGTDTYFSASAHCSHYDGDC